jgi:hypothetical protein
MTLRHFPYRHPTFGTESKPKTPAHWQLSVYYWWFEYLRRNDDYLMTCENNGKGKCSGIYEHFGDLRNRTFKEWWSEDDRGAVLFAEPPTPSIQVVLTDRLVEGGFLRENTLILEVPLGLPINYLVKNFRELISKRHEGKRGKRQNLTSKALYLAKGKVDVGFLRIALAVWDMKAADPKKPFWLVADELGLAGPNQRIKPTDTQAELTDKKNLLAATASRYYRKATEMIKRTGEGKFPH